MDKNNQDSNSNKDTFYVTTAIDYASGNPHIGHAYEKVSADVIARWNRNIGRKVFFLTGTDEHGQKIADTAKEAGKEVQEFVDLKAERFKGLCRDLKITNDYFIRTTQNEHKRFVQEMLQKSFDNGDIYKGEYEGLYCVGCERYYKEDELEDGKFCPAHKKEVQKLKQENYFFRLSKYEDKLLELYKNNPDFISPKSKQMEIINRVKEGLEDISVSRNKEMLEWGIEFPFDSEHVTYVWFDALFNYLSAPTFNDKAEEFWPCDVHIIGYDIMWFHTVYWPAFLMSCGYDLPNKVFSHGMILDSEGHKMSKSLNNVIDPYDMIKKYGVDEFRFFVLALGTYGDDLNFGEEAFIEKINNDLNNDFGNLVSRVHTMITKYFDGSIPDVDNLEAVDKKLIEKMNFFEEFNSEMQSLRYNRAIEVLWSRIRDVNAYINETEAWKVKDENRLKAIVNLLASCVKLFAEYVDCFMPEKSEKIFKQLSLIKENSFEFKHLSVKEKIGVKENIFEKIKMEKENQNTSTKPESEVSKFSKMDLRVGKIVEIKEHPDAEKLYIEKIDLGNGEIRQIISGLKDHYTTDELLGKKVIVICNLLPAKLRGEMSEGMILAADSKETGQVGVVTTDEEIGSVVKLDSEEPAPEKEFTFDMFQKIKIKSTDNGVVSSNMTVVCNGKPVTVDRGIIGKVR
ncbi:methionine--tRNA ligase [archaeon D22]|nr:methionine--tRNA ligase [archaeon D22]